MFDPVWLGNYIAPRWVAISVTSFVFAVLATVVLIFVMWCISKVVSLLKN